MADPVTWAIIGTSLIAAKTGYDVVQTENAKSEAKKANEEQSGQQKQILAQAEEQALQQRRTGAYEVDAAGKQSQVAQQAAALRRNRGLLSGAQGRAGTILGVSDAQAPASNSLSTPTILGG